MPRLAFLLIMGFGALCGLIALIALPHDRYYRYQADQILDSRKSDWIFERLHFDDTPVDVALIGTSRSRSPVALVGAFLRGHVQLSIVPHARTAVEKRRAGCQWFGGTWGVACIAA